MCFLGWHLFGYYASPQDLKCDDFQIVRLHSSAMVPSFLRIIFFCLPLYPISFSIFTIDRAGKPRQPTSTVYISVFHPFIFAAFATSSSYLVLFNSDDISTLSSVGHVSSMIISCFNASDVKMISGRCVVAAMWHGMLRGAPGKSTCIFQSLENRRTDSSVTDGATLPFSPDFLNFIHDFFFVNVLFSLL